MKTIILLLIGLTACQSVTGLPGSVPFSPPASYTKVWAEVENCLGRTGNFTAIQWRYVPATPDWQYSWPCETSGNGSCAGLYDPNTQTIYLTEFAVTDSIAGGITTIAYPDSVVNYQALSFPTLRHEIQHALTNDLQHRSPLWEQCTNRIRL